MSEKVLHEFSQRITRAKMLLDGTKSQCSSLKKEALRLEKVDYFQTNKSKAEILGV